MHLSCFGDGLFTLYMWVFPRKLNHPKMDGLKFKMENPIKMDDLGVPLFSETSMYIL